MSRITIQDLNSASINYLIDKCKNNGIKLSTLSTEIRNIKSDRNSCDLIIRYFEKIVNAWLNSNNKNARSLATIITSCSKLRIKSELLFILISDIQYYFKDFNPQETANIIWGLATLNINLEENIINHLKESIIYNYNDFNAQDTANTIWELAKLNINLEENIIYLFENFN